MWHSPFDLYYWFVNVLAGNTQIFLAIAFLVIAMLAGMFRMPTIIVGTMFSLFIVMLSITITGTYFVLALLLIGLMVGWIVSRYLK